MSEKKLFEAGGGGAGNADLGDLNGRERIGHENGINPDALNATGDKMIEPVSAPVNVPKPEAPKPVAPKPKAPAPKPAFVILFCKRDQVVYGRVHQRSLTHDSPDGFAWILQRPDCLPPL